MQDKQAAIHLPGGLNMPPFGIHQYLALMIVMVSLWALGSVWLGLQGTGQWVGVWQKQMVMHVYVPQNKKANASRLKRELAKIEAVESVEYVSRLASARWMQQWLGDSSLEVGNMAKRLPETWVVHLIDDPKRNFAIDDVRDVADSVGGSINDDEVQLLEMRQVLAKAETLAWFVTLLLAMAMALIVSNTLRMILLARADEVHLMRLLGAKEWFVRMPFVLEGMVLGAAAAVLAWFLLWPWVWASSDWLAGSTIDLHVGVLLLPLLFGGVLVGALGALIATARLVSPDSVEA